MPHTRCYRYEHFRTFYLVVRHGGITASLPHFGYGVQQPAISEQMLKLEEVLGRKLFVRHPFRLLPAGEALYAAIRPYQEALADVLERLTRTDQPPTLRVAAADVMLGEFLPSIVSPLLKALPELRIDFKGGTVAERVACLERGEVEFAIAATRASPAGLKWRPLLRLPPVLVVARSVRLPADLRRWPQPLPRVAVPADPPEIAQAFAAGLAAWKLAWEPRLEVPTVEHAGWFATQPDYVGLTLDLPSFTQKHGLRAIRLPESLFPPVEVRALWREPASAPARAFLAAVEAAAAKLQRTVASP